MKKKSLHYPKGVLMMGLETVFAGFPKPTLSDPEVVIGGPDPLEISQVISVSKEISI